MKIFITVFWMCVGFIFTFTFGYSAGFDRGIFEGMAKQKEFEKKVLCEFDYGDVAQKDIPGDCLKYFLKGE